ncbi:LpqN/LpqT family lipoprotein [Nocardia sp. NPDC046473]|uniref:LpqN/LpqT family lipoprotein n=1 Tax=Nocardia sp. NPDC046473 TaxID=3155733 RepID=UPI0033FFFE27
MPGGERAHADRTREHSVGIDPVNRQSHSLFRSVPMAMAALAALAACGAPDSEPPPTSTSSKPASAVHYSCDANAATGLAFTSDRRPGQPFSVLVPELPGWQRTDGPGTDTSGLAIQRRDQLPGDFRSPTATITVNRLEPTDTVAAAVDMMRRTAQTTPGWHTRDDHPITVCGQNGGQVTGTFTLAQAEWWEDHRLVVCACDGAIRPVLLVARAKQADLDRLGADLTTILDGVQIVP